MQKFSQLLLLLGLIAVNVNVGAASITGLYEAEVPVPDKELAQRETAFGAALRDVLIKLTGHRSPQAKPVVARALANAPAFVEQFQYRTLTLEPLDEGELASEELLLWTRFDAASLDKLVAEANLPVWGRTRPSVLVWMALESDSSRALVGRSESANLIGVLEQAAKRRGVPIVIPFLDEIDRGQVTVADVWAGFEDRIELASERYRADALLLVRGYTNAQGNWEGRWRLLQDTGIEDWGDSDARLDEVLAQGIDRVADLLAARYATILNNNSNDGSVELSVTFVRNVNDYARLVDYLAGLDGVARVDVVGVEEDRVKLALQARGGPSLVARMISLGRLLSPVPGSDDLQYRLNR